MKIIVLHWHELKRRLVKPSDLGAFLESFRGKMNLVDGPWVSISCEACGAGLTPLQEVKGIKNEDNILDPEEFTDQPLNYRFCPYCGEKLEEGET